MRDVPDGAGLSVYTVMAVTVDDSENIVVGAQQVKRTSNVSPLVSL